jgi:hypothetical protein
MRLRNTKNAGKKAEGGNGMLYEIKKVDNPCESCEGDCPVIVGVC